MATSVYLVCALVVSAAAVSRPPGIFSQPDYNVYYKSGETVKMPCVAEGEPQPSYKWQRNEIEFNPSGNDDRIVRLPNIGTLVINNPEDKDEGIFQCFAENDFGRSASRRVNLREAKLDQFAKAAAEYHEPKLGEGYTLNCVPPNSVPPASVFWVIKDSMGGIDVVNYDDRITMDREYHLRITNVKREDHNDGKPFACMAMNNIMRSNSQGPLHYLDPTGTEDYHPVAYMWSDQDDRFGLKGQRFTVKCIFSGNPTPDVHWERTDGKPLSDRADLRSFAQELVIEPLEFEDAGAYECWATNSVSSERQIRTFNIRVQSKPYWVQEPQDVEIGVGGDVEFTCMAGGDPAPRISWFINGVSLDTSDDPRIKPPGFSHPVENKIFFYDVEQTDYMCIQCNASNKHGYVFSDSYLNVLSEAPTIIKPPLAQKVSAEGQPVNLTCRTTGKPDPIITWFKNGDQITGGRYRILINGDLHIRAVVLADAGHYRCQAQNKFNITSADGTLVVRRKTRIEQFPMDLEVNAGTDAKFTCSGTTDPEEVNNLQILWLKDNKAITTTDQRMTTNKQDNSLTISGCITRDSGTYTCIATNGLDNSTASAMLTVRDRPDPPTKVRHEFCDKNATIHWMPGPYNNAPIQYYVLQYNTSFNPDKWNFGLRINATLSKVNMTLSPYVNYTFRIIAYNKIGPSDPSFPSPEICSTKPARPAYNPRNLRTIGHQNGKLYIEWTPVPPLNQNGPGFQYLLQILREGAQRETETQSIPLGDWRTYKYELSTGRVYEPYKITMKSINNVGEASEDPSEITGHSYENTPQITPTNLVVEAIGDTFAIFKWDFDKREIDKKNTKIRGEFRGFKIQFWEENERGLTIREHNVGPESALNITGNTFTATVEDMLPYTNMEAQVAVKNNYYIGSPTEPIRFRTLSGLPGPVEYFQPINIGDTHVNLEWRSPVENRGDLLGYDISYRLVEGLDLGEIQEREPQINDPWTTNAYLNGLKPKSKYRIYIYARTISGRGEGYFIEVVTKKPGIPRMPRFTIANKGRTFINVSWWVDAYAKSGSIIYVEYRKLDGAEWLRTTDEVINTWKNVSNLEPGTKYELRVKATNGPISMASGIEEVTTDGTAKAYMLVGNIGWFIGMLLSILLIIGLIVAFVVCYKRGFRFERRERPASYYGGAHQPYSGTYDNTARVDRDSDHFGPEPRGYNNEYYDDKDYHNYDYSDEKRPPNYNDHDTRAAPDEYEDYDPKSAAAYDRDYDRREPDAGAPQNYYDDNRGYHRDDYPNDGYRDDYYNRQDDYDDRHDDYDDRQRDDYDDRRRDDYDDRRDDYYDRRDDYRDDRRRDNYDDEPRKQPSAPSSSTFV